MKKATDGVSTNGPATPPLAAAVNGEARGARPPAFPHQPHSAAPVIPGYQLTSPLGHGTVATAWKAVQVRTGRQVAVRVFMQAAGVNWPFLRQEVDRLVLLDRHPHVLSLLDADLDHVPPYYVTELMEGGSLQPFVDPGRHVKPVVVAQWMEEIARALVFAHGKGIIHGDLKPANVMLDAHGQVRVAEFGQVRVLTDAHGVLGALCYVAPEQAHRAVPHRSGMPSDVGAALQPDVRWDLYALGAIAYALLTGEPPHAAALTQGLRNTTDLGARLDLYRQVVAAHSLRPLKSVQYVDGDLVAIVRKCLEPELARRYGTALEVVHDLGHRKAHRPVSPLAHSRVHRARKLARRNLGTTLLAAAALLVLATSWAVMEATHNADMVRALRVHAVKMTRLGEYDEAAAYWAELNRRAPSAGTRANALAALALLPAPLARLEQGDDVGVVAFNHAGTRLVTGSKDGQARLWDAATGRPVGSPLQHQDWVTAVAFSPDGLRVATGSRDHTARIWDAATGAPVGGVLQHGDEVTSVSFSPDGAHLATGSADRTVGVWETGTGRPVGPLRRHLDRVVDVMFNRDGLRVAAASWDGTGQVWCARRTMRLGKPLRHLGRLNGVAFSPDGLRVATASWDHTARIWMAATGKPVGAVMAHLDQVTCLAWSPDGARLVTGSADRTARVWDAATGAPVGEVCRHPEQVLAVAFSPDSRWIATGGRDGMARIWEAATGEPAGACRHGGWVTAVAFSPDGRRLAVAAGAERAAQVWDVSTLAPRLRRIVAPVWGECSRVSADRTVAVIGDFKGAIHVFDARTGNEQRAIAQHPGGIQCIAISPDGARVATAGYDHQIRFWNVMSARQAGDPGMHDGMIMVMAYSPAGRWVVTGSADHTARIWDPETALPVGEPMRHKDTVLCAAFSPDERRLVTGCADGTAAVWDTASGRPMLPPFPHRGPVLSVAFSPDGTRIATGSADATARLWDAATGRPVGPVLHHREGVGTVAFSPSGALLATGSADKTVRVWDAATGKPAGAPLAHTQTVATLCWSGSGDYLAVGEYGDLVRLWALPEGVEVGEPLKVGSDVSWLQFGPEDRTLFASGNGLAQIQVWATPYLAARPVAQALLNDALARTRFRVNRLGFPERPVPAAL